MKIKRLQDEKDDLEKEIKEIDERIDEAKKRKPGFLTVLVWATVLALGSFGVCEIALGSICLSSLIATVLFLARIGLAERIGGRELQELHKIREELTTKKRRIATRDFAQEK